ncbi:protein of unknown function DUF885 [Gordonia polyisoprenivorans VH2]|uniref:DUF885 domain-containing protein n=1 Tax=Gordonia polyisoprenivorans (strain DSM 44266 / VH2) TaxID=1112204 RepID=H6N0N8_GORPV|nr:protein of unknown function DUF885 [Gordonia polyisoprenivorans VH2]
MPSARTSTAVDAIADAHLRTMAADDPILATELGIDDAAADRLTDFSPDAVATRAEHTRATLAALGAAEVSDDVDRVTVATMTASLRRELALADAGELTGVCNVIASPLQAIRDIFDLMDTGSPAARETMVRRIAAIPDALTTAIAGLEQRRAAGPPFARRQVELVAAQADQALAAISANTGSIVADPELAADLESATTAAGSAFADFAGHLRTGVAPDAVDDDAVGRDRYLLHLPHYLGADADPEEAYDWGLDHLREIVAEQQAIATQLVPGGSVADALAALDADARYQIHDKQAFVDWMQATSDAAVDGLAGTHFEIPSRLTRLECRLAPSSTGIIYYTQPAADLSRPGRMWWAVPPGQTVFHTWQEKTTVYHEGVPGHHLQLGSAIVDDDLNSWRKLASFTSGHGEGWALYAERLMAELGWLDDPGDRMGMLDSQRLRAARVVVDIGVHCRLRAPESFGGGIWDAEKAWRFLTSSVAMDRAVLRFELDRYLGWPGQAPSYALGQRVWEQTRDAALAAHPGWTLKEFHTRALALGGVSLDVLAEQMRRAG